MDSTSDDNNKDKLIKYARAIELGRVIARDIGGADPERMAPPRVAEYIQDLFLDSSDIKVIGYIYKYRNTKINYRLI